MFHRFAYESEFYPALTRVPMHVRMKLDGTGVKISLDDWLAFGLEERRVLCHLPVETEEEKQVFVRYLDFLSRKCRGRPAALTVPLDSRLWDCGHLPAAVAEKSAAGGRAITAEEWARFEPHERYALYKTANSTRDTEAFFILVRDLLAART